MAILRIPALIDPHVHPIDNDLQSWRQLARAARSAGYAAIQLMPDIDPPITDKLSLAHYGRYTKQAAIPLYLAAAGTPQNSQAIKQLHNITAVKVWLGTGPEDLIVTKEEELRQLLLSTDKVVMIHAEDETTLLRNYDSGNQELSMARHPLIFDRTAAIRAAVKAITAAKETGRRIYLCHISTGEEVEIVRQAKAKGIRVYAEVAPHHLFLTEDDVTQLGVLGKVNPPLRTAADQEALWEGINNGTIDTIGSDTHLWQEKEKEGEYAESPAGLPNIELVLPLMLTAVKEKRLTLNRAVELLSTNPARIFGIPKPTRSLFVDMDNPRPATIEATDWHPYPVTHLVGWPIRETEEQPQQRS